MQKGPDDHRPDLLLESLWPAARFPASVSRPMRARLAVRVFPPSELDSSNYLQATLEQVSRQRPPT